MSIGTTGTSIDEMCDDVFRLEGIVESKNAEIQGVVDQLDAAWRAAAKYEDEIARLNRESTKLAIAAQDGTNELQVARDVVAIRDDRIATLETQLEVARGEIVSQSKDVARKHETIAGQLKRIEDLDNQLQNKLCDISALEDSMSDRDTVRRSVKFNAVHMLKSAIAVLNGL
jgi:chromosome segregation ATPase